MMREKYDLLRNPVFPLTEEEEIEYLLSIPVAVGIEKIASC